MNWTDLENRRRPVVDDGVHIADDGYNITITLTATCPTSCCKCSGTRTIVCTKTIQTTARNPR